MSEKCLHCLARGHYKFLIFNSYKDARDSFRQRIEDGSCTWYGKGIGLANEFSFYARIAWTAGLVSLHPTCTRMIVDNIQNETTLQSLSTEASTRKAQTYLRPTVSGALAHWQPGPWVARAPLATSVTTRSTSCNHNALSVNLEDDTEDDSGSDSNSMAPEEVEAVYNIWRQIPEEKSPWASTASLLDKLRGVITRQKPQR